MITQSQIDRLRNATNDSTVLKIIGEWELELKEKALRSGNKINLKLVNTRTETTTEVLAVPVLDGLFAYHKEGTAYTLTHVGTGYAFCSLIDLKDLKALIVDMAANMNKELLQKFDTDNVKVMGTLAAEERELLQTLVKKHR